VGGSNDTTSVRVKEQVAVWKGGKGKQVKPENKISNPVQVSGFEAYHGTL